MSNRDRITEKVIDLYLKAYDNLEPSYYFDSLLRKELNSIKSICRATFKWEDDTIIINWVETLDFPENRVEMSGVKYYTHQINLRQVIRNRKIENILK